MVGYLYSQVIPFGKQKQRTDGSYSVDALRNIAYLRYARSLFARGITYRL